MDAIEFFTERQISLDHLERLAHEHGYQTNRVLLGDESLVIQCSTESGIPYLRVSQYAQPQFDRMQFQDMRFSPKNVFAIEFRKAWVDDLITFMLIVLEEYGGYVGTEVTSELLSSETLPDLEQLYERYK